MDQKRQHLGGSNIIKLQETQNLPGRASLEQVTVSYLFQYHCSFQMN